MDESRTTPADVAGIITLVVGVVVGVVVVA